VRSLLVLPRTLPVAAHSGSSRRGASGGLAVVDARAVSRSWGRSPEEPSGLTCPVQAFEVTALGRRGRSWVPSPSWGSSRTSPHLGGTHVPNTIERSIDVDVPVRTAYDQWTQFEDFPHFMSDVERIEQLDDTTTRWHVKLLGVERTFDADITEQIPDERVAWTSRSDAETAHAGVVTFHRIDDGRTRVMLQLDIEPSDWIEKAGQALGLVERRVQDDLEDFKTFIEERGTETGAYRGQVDQDPTA
jgi:uncharacterized membrane protein